MPYLELGHFSLNPPLFYRQRTEIGLLYSQTGNLRRFLTFRATRRQWVMLAAIIFAYLTIQALAFLLLISGCLLAGATDRRAVRPYAPAH